MASRSKIFLITSSGGHLLKTYLLREWWSQHDRAWVTRDDEITRDLLKKERVFYGYFPENRHLIHAVKNFLLAMKILAQERPQWIFSTGAGIAVPFFLVAKLLGIQTIFMETFMTIPRPTLTGKLVYHLSTVFIVQHPQLINRYPKAQYWGKLLP